MFYSVIKKDLQIIINRILCSVNTETEKGANKNKHPGWWNYCFFPASIVRILVAICLFNIQNIVD